MSMSRILLSFFSSYLCWSLVAIICNLRVSCHAYLTYFWGNFTVNILWNSYQLACISISYTFSIINFSHDNHIDWYIKQAYLVELSTSVREREQFKYKAIVDHLRYFYIFFVLLDWALIRLINEWMNNYLYGMVIKTNYLIIIYFLMYLSHKIHLLSINFIIFWYVHIHIIYISISSRNSVNQLHTWRSNAPYLKIIVRRREEEIKKNYSAIVKKNLIHSSIKQEMEMIIKRRLRRKGVVY